MKIEVARRDIEAALQIAKIGKTSSSEDLQSHYVFRNDSGCIRIYTFNGRVGVSTPLTCQASDTIDKEAFSIEGWRLDQWLNAVGDVALKLESKDAVVTASAPTGAVKFRSLDTSSFPYWDDKLSSSAPTLSIKARRLQGALAHVKGFILENDTGRPEMAVTEARKGSLWATDQTTLAIVTLAELAKSSLRVHGRDIASVTGFLSAVGDEVVEVRECEYAAFVSTANGTVLSIGRPHLAFVELDEDVLHMTEDPYWWSLGCEDLDRVIKQLAAGAEKKDTRLTFSFEPGSTAKVRASMVSTSGSTNSLLLECHEYGGTEKSSDGQSVSLPEEGWSINYKYLQKILASYQGGKAIRLGLHPMGETGVTRIAEDRNGDRFLTILVWSA